MVEISCVLRDNVAPEIKRITELHDDPTMRKRFFGSGPSGGEGENAPDCIPVWALARGWKIADGIAAGVLFSGEHFFVAEGLRFVGPSHMVAMLDTASAFAALGLHALMPEERLRPAQWAGPIPAFGGIAAGGGFGRPCSVDVIK